MNDEMFRAEYPPAGTFAHGYQAAALAESRRREEPCAVRRSIIVLGVGVVAIVAVLVAFSVFLSGRAASVSAGLNASTTVSAGPSPYEESSKVEEARSEAQALLGEAAFSRQALIEVLSDESLTQRPYSTAVATTAVDSLDVDWSQQAQRAAQEVVDSGVGVSPQSLLEFLSLPEMAGFTEHEARAGMESLTVNWAMEAMKAAEFNLTEGLSSHASLYDDLIFEGFTEEQARDAVASVGADSATRTI